VASWRAGKFPAERAQGLLRLHARQRARASHGSPSEGSRQQAPVSPPGPFSAGAGQSQPGPEFRIHESNSPKRRPFQRRSRSGPKQVRCTYGRQPKKPRAHNRRDAAEVGNSCSDLGIDKASIDFTEARIHKIPIWRSNGFLGTASFVRRSASGHGGAQSWTSETPNPRSTMIAIGSKPSISNSSWGQRRRRGLSFDHLVGAAPVDFPDQLSEQFCSDAAQAACLRPKDSIALASPASECRRTARHPGSALMRLWTRATSPVGRLPISARSDAR
jgi:hypothetical protein